MSEPERRVYSPERLRLVLILLTLVTLPVVIGASVFIYYYLRFGVMVDRRLQGERWMVPSRIYARPLVLAEALPLTSRDLVKTLNGLKYEQKKEGTPQPGQFVAGDKSLALFPRPIPGSADEPLLVVAVRVVKDVANQGTPPPRAAQLRARAAAEAAAAAASQAGELRPTA